MKNKLYINALVGELETPISETDTLILYSPITETPLPTLSTNEWFTLSIQEGFDIEIVKVVAIDGFMLTVERGYENTTPMNWNKGVNIGNRLTSKDAKEFNSKQDSLSGGVENTPLVADNEGNPHYLDWVLNVTDIDIPKPIMRFDFANQGILDPRIEFSRNSLDWDDQGNEYGINVPVITEDGLWISGTRNNLFLENTDMTKWALQNCTVSKLNSWFEFTRTEEGVPSRPFSDSDVKANTIYTISVDAEEGSARYLRIFARVLVEGTILEPYANFDLQTGEVMIFNNRGDTDFYAGSVVNEDGSRRFYITFNTKDSTSVGAFFNISERPNANGSTAPAGATFKLRNPNFTEGAGLTPNIPTEGSAVTVAPSFQSVPKQLKGDYTVFVDFTPIAPAFGSNVTGVFSVFKSNTNSIAVTLYEKMLRLTFYGQGSINQTIYGFEYGQRYKVAVTFRGDNVWFFVNGEMLLANQGLTNSITNDFDTLVLGSHILIGTLTKGTNFFHAVSVFDKNLTDVQLQELTS